MPQLPDSAKIATIECLEMLSDDRLREQMFVAPNVWRERKIIREMERRGMEW